MRLKSLRGVVGRASNLLLSFLSYDLENKKKITKIHESLRERQTLVILQQFTIFCTHEGSVCVDDLAKQTALFSFLLCCASHNLMLYSLKR